MVILLAKIFVLPTRIDKSKVVSWFPPNLIISSIFAAFFNLHYKNRIITINYFPQKKIITVILIILYFTEFIYCKTIPLFQGATYIDFGIPTLHVFIVTFSCYYSIKNYLQYITFKKTNDLLNFIIVITYFILIFSRGILIFLFTVMAALMLYDKKIKLKYILLFALTIVFFSWIFGITGNIRSGYKWNDSHIILYYSQIDFDRNNLLAPLFWVEEYIICSLRNLNYNIVNFSASYSLFSQLYSIVPDFIAKRIFSGYEVVPKLQVLAFTTSTMYAKVYLSYGYIGMISNFLLLIFVYGIFKYANFLDSSNKIIGYAILSFIFALSIFNDMLWYSGYSFSLFYCFIMGVKPSLRKKIPRIFLRKKR